MKDAARHTVLGAVRHHLREALARGTLPPARDALSPGPASPRIEGLEDRVAAFVERLGAVGGKVWRVGDAAGAASAVEEILAEHGARKVAFSDAPICRDLLERLGENVETVDPSDREALFGADAGVTSAQHAVAETGTLVLVSSDERHRLASLVPPLHVAVLRTDAMLDTMAAALRAVHADGPAPTVTFVTGPSRTADIELTLVVGVHGPRHLHVVLVDAS